MDILGLKGANACATPHLADLATCGTALIVTPAQHMGRVLDAMPGFPRDLVLCSKGIEASSGRMMHEVAKQAAPGSAISPANPVPMHFDSPHLP